MKLAFAVAASFALAAPVLAQPPSARTDWTKPVVGVDAPLAPPKAEEVSFTVALEQVLQNALPEDGSAPPKPPPCEPPVTKAKAGALPPPCAPPPS